MVLTQSSAISTALFSKEQIIYLLIELIRISSHTLWYQSMSFILAGKYFFVSTCLISDNNNDVIGKIIYYLHQKVAFSKFVFTILVKTRSNM